MTGALECMVGFNVNDEPRSLQQLLKNLHPIHIHHDAGTCNLDLSKSRYLGPDAATVLLATILEGRKRGQTFRVDLPTAPPALDAFCLFSGLKHWLGGGKAPDPEHPQNETVPLRQIFDARFNDIDPILRLLERHVDLDADAAETLRFCFNEVIQNVKDHALSRIGCVCCARCLSRRGEVRVAVVDRGRGIATTLREGYPEIPSAPFALQRVIEGGFTARSRETNTGAGVSYLWANVRRLNGSIFIISEDGIASLTRKGDSIRSLDPPFSGTGVFFTLPVTGQQAT